MLGLVATLAGVAIVGSGSRATTRALVSSAPGIYVEYFTIPYYTSLTIQTTASSSGADPVLHLLRVNSNGTYTQVVSNDNWSGVEARISFTNTTWGSSDFVMILRAKSQTTQGTCDLLMNGTDYHSGVPVGGVMIASSSMIFGAGDELRTVHVPGGSVAPALVKFSTSSAMTISGLAMANGVGGASVLPLTGTEYHFMVGTPWVRNGARYLTPRAGAANVMANDIANDADGDGVGNALEATLGLCAATTGCPNNGTGHGRDTDRDGLSDGEELWGVAGTLPDGSDDLPFARWGANARKKDVFLEVDYLTGIGGVLGVDTNPFQWMRANPTSSIGGWIGSPEVWFTTAQAPFLAGPTAHLKNPDGTNGVALHLDLGVPPINPSNEAKFGAWSTGASRALVPDFILRVVDVIDGDVTVDINGQQQTFAATGLSPVSIAAMAALAIMSTGEPVTFKSLTDHGNDTATLLFGTSVPGQHFTRGVTVPAGYGHAILTPLESTNALVARYTVATQVDSVRVGRVRYGVVTGVGGGGQAIGARFASGLQHGAFVHELGHTLGIEHWGHNQWNTSGECLPHYQSLMRYGAGPWAFSSTDDVLYLNAAATRETNTFGAGYDHSIFAPWPYSYTATASAVDWNRDGTYTSSSVYWRTMAMSIFDSSCAAFVQGHVNIAPNEEVVGPVDLVRHGTRLYAFWSTGSALKYRFASLGGLGNKSCTGSADPAVGDCLTWSSTHTLFLGGSYLGVSAYSHSGNIFLAHHSATGQLTMRRLTVNGNGTLSLWMTWSISTSGPQTRAAAPPELVELHSSSLGGALSMLYLAETGIFRQYRWTGSGWISGGDLLDPNGAAISGGDAPGAVAWPDASVAGFFANEKRTVAILPSNSGELRVFVLDYGTGRWVNLNIAGLGSTAGKPFIAYRHQRRSDGAPRPDFPGHFLFGRMSPCDGGHCARVRVGTPVSRTTLPGPGMGALLAGDYLHNVWAISPVGTSAALFSDSTIDNVFGLAPIAVPGLAGPNFYPHADGSPDHVHGVRSDFRVMEDGICVILGAYRGFACGPMNVLD